MRRQASFRLRLEFLEQRAVPAAGDLDLSFGDGGKVITNFNAQFVDSAEAVAVAPDGKIVVVGDTGGDFAVARYRPNGQLDGGFSVDGKVTTDFDLRLDTAVGVVVQADGKIVVVGSTFDPNPRSTRIAVARYNVNGTLDTSFDGDGKWTGVTLPGDSVASAIALQADGRILIGGRLSGDTSTFLVIRLLQNGALDATFGAGGLVTTVFPGAIGADVTALAVRPDGRIVAAGQGIRVVSETEFESDIVLAQYNSQGQLDPGFGVGGRVVDPVPGDDRIHSMDLGPDGKIVVAGEFNDHIGVARYVANGGLGLETARDPDFDGDGRVQPGFDERAGVAVQDDGKIIVVGTVFFDEPISNLAVARYHIDGSPDPDFGNGDGQVLVTFGFGTADGGTAVALQPDGRIVVAGNTNRNDDGDFAVARLSAGYRLFQFESKLTIRVDEVARLAILASGAGSIDLFDGARLLGSFSGVDQIDLETQDGNDQVRFTAEGLSTPIDVAANLRGGTDRFFLAVPPNPITPAGAQAFRTSGSSDADQITVGRDPDNPGGVLVRRTNLTPFAIALDNTEELSVETFAGSDTVTVNDLTGTDLALLLLDGGAGDDVLDGSAQTSTALAMTMYGGAGRDRLQGGAGADSIDGGGRDGAIDVLLGGRGADTFHLDVIFGGLDVPLDFNLLHGDRIASS